jgi:uncharacterized protein YkwD
VNRRLLIPLLAASAALVPAPAQASICPLGERVRPLTVTTFCLVNEARARHGARRLRPDPRLAHAARRHSREMVARGYFSHTSWRGLSSRARIERSGWMAGRGRWTIGETLAWHAGSPDPREIVRRWLASPPHRRVLLHRRFRVAGIGIAAGTPRSTPGTTYTADFGT